jgi:cytoskeletal protein RodZ
VVDTNRSRSTLNRRGQALSEYAMLVAMVGMGLVVILGLFGRVTKQAWQKSESKFADEPSVAATPSPAPYGGGGAASGSVQPTPPPPSTPAPPPKKDSSDSSSAADSLGAPPDNPIGQAPEPGQDPLSQER